MLLEPTAGSLLLESDISQISEKIRNCCEQGSRDDNLPTQATVADFLAKSTTIDRVKLCNANPAFLDAFAANAPSISLAVSIPNSALPSFANRPKGLDVACGWLRDNLSPHVTVGAKEVLSPTVARDLVVALLPAMRRLSQAL